ncbi:alpha/beta fold hydrolase [Nocardia noduli]|uniref:alpha/beta fold hydrolase n=1 Tax=Nocardia noduli TaxID=2815722 RepID=UPI001C249DF0|nr:alpha/beta fold hydrolase [Nocardia noduli]
MSFWTSTLGAQVRYHHAGPWRTRALEAGDIGEHVVMIGGLTGHIEGFAHNVVPLAERGLRVHAIDTIGHGFTDKPLDVTYHAPLFTDHLLRFLDALGIEKAHMVGQSLGGWIALHTARTHPDRIGKIVFATGAGILLDDDAAKKESADVHSRVQSVTKKAIDAPTRDSVRTRLEWLMADPNTVTEELIDARYRIYTLPDSRAAMPKLVAEQPSEENRAYLLTEDRLSQLPHEVLVLWTDKNPTTQASVGRRASELLPNGSFTMISDAGHWPMFEQPERFNTIVGDFLTGPHV